MQSNLFGINIDELLKDLWGEVITKGDDGTYSLSGSEYSEHITMLQRNSTKIKTTLSSIVLQINQYILDNMSSKTDLNNVITSLSEYIKNEKIAVSINDADTGKLITVSILKLLKDELTQDYQSQLDLIKDTILVDDTTLDELREIVAYIKQNREILQELNINNLAGYTELDTRIQGIESNVQTNLDKIESLNKVDIQITTAPGVTAFAYKTSNNIFIKLILTKDMNLTNGDNLATIITDKPAENFYSHLMNRNGDTGIVNVLTNGSVNYIGSNIFNTTGTTNFGYLEFSYSI